MKGQVVKKDVCIANGIVFNVVDGGSILNIFIMSKIKTKHKESIQGYRLELNNADSGIIRAVANFQTRAYILGMDSNEKQSTGDSRALL